MKKFTNIKLFLAHLKISYQYLFAYLINFKLISNLRNTKFISRIGAIITYLQRNTIYKIFKSLLRIIAILNILLGVGVILAYNDFNLKDPFIYLAIIYSNFPEYILNSFETIIRSIIENLTKLITNKDNVKALPKEPVLNRKDYVFNQAIDPQDSKSNFYSSPYFYLPIIIVIGSITIYYNYESITTFLVTSGIMNFFNDYPTPPSNPDENNIPGSSNIDLKDYRNNNDKTPLVLINSVDKDNVWLDHKPEFKTFFRDPKIVPIKFSLLLPSK